MFVLRRLLLDLALLAVVAAPVMAARLSVGTAYSPDGERVLYRIVFGYPTSASRAATSP